MTMLDFLFLFASSAAPAAPPDGSVSTGLLYGIITAIVTGVVGTIMRYQGKAIGRREEQARQQGSIVIENQPIGMKLHSEFATRAELEAMRETHRVEMDQVHSRVNGAFRGLDTLRGVVEGVGSNVDRLLDHAFQLPPGTSTRARRKHPKNQDTDD